MTWSFVGGAGNAADTTGFGAVAYDYNVGTYEVTNSQYAEFLNAKAASDPLGLYNVFMGSVASGGGISRTGAPGSFTYTAISGRESRPVNFVSYYDSLRFSTG
jgi:formylglycine-generating enzyme required for sulfatase activity